MAGLKGWGTRMVLTPSFWLHLLVFEAIRALISFRGTRRQRTAYWRWRLQTAYGSPDVSVPTPDMIAYLRWRRRQRIAGR